MSVPNSSLAFKICLSWRTFCKFDTDKVRETPALTAMRRLRFTGLEGVGDHDTETPPVEVLAALNESKTILAGAGSRKLIIYATPT